MLIGVVLSYGLPSFNESDFYAPKDAITLIDQLPKFERYDVGVHSAESMHSISTVTLSNGGGTISINDADAWSLTGNTGTVDGTNCIGTTDDIPFTIRVNNQKAGRIGASTEGNTFFGYQSGNSNTGNNSNTGIGQYALFANTTGNENTASGFQALYSNTTGNDNTANGYASIYSNTTGFANTAFGVFTMYSNTTGNYKWIRIST